MNKLLGLATLIAILIVIILVVLVTQRPIQGNTLLYEKSESWGPCPPNGTCQQSTKLYYSGRLVVKGATELQKQLTQQEINDLIAKIKSTHIMRKECSAPIVLDYSATYRLNVSGKQKTIRFPGCKEELQEIEELIPDET